MNPMFFSPPPLVLAEGGDGFVWGEPDDHLLSLHRSIESLRQQESSLKHSYEAAKLEQLPVKTEIDRLQSELSEVETSLHRARYEMETYFYDTLQEKEERLERLMEEVNESMERRAVFFWLLALVGIGSLVCILLDFRPWYLFEGGVLCLPFLIAPLSQLIRNEPIVKQVRELQRLQSETRYEWNRASYSSYPTSSPERAELLMSIVIQYCGKEDKMIAMYDLLKELIKRPSKSCLIND